MTDGRDDAGGIVPPYMHPPEEGYVELAGPVGPAGLFILTELVRTASLVTMAIALAVIAW